MSFKVEQDANSPENTCNIVIDEEMSIYTIGALKHELSEALNIYDAFQLDLAGIEDFDSTGIQLLLCLKQEIIRLNKQFKINSVSEAVSKVFTLYGIKDNFSGVVVGKGAVVGKDKGDV